MLKYLRSFNEKGAETKYYYNTFLKSFFSKAVFPEKVTKIFCQAESEVVVVNH